jgi:hypothetical protein
MSWKDYNNNPEATLFKVWGMRRVGNHAIIEWISKHFNKTIHNNDIISGRPWVIKEYGTGNVVDLQIDSYEDFEPRLDSEPDSNTIFLLRDWYNVCASRHVSGRGWTYSARHFNGVNYNRSCSEVYLKYCELYEKYPDNFILYNQWVEDESYLKSVEQRYDWKHIPRDNKMPKSGIGGGSSFSNEVVDPKRFNQRYKDVMENDKDNWELMIGDSKINDYCEKIFNMKVTDL